MSSFLPCPRFDIVASPLPPTAPTTAHAACRPSAEKAAQTGARTARRPPHPRPTPDPHPRARAAVAERGVPYPPHRKVCMVTGGTGFVGQRLVEMLVQCAPPLERQCGPLDALTGGGAGVAPKRSYRSTWFRSPRVPSLPPRCRCGCGPPTVAEAWDHPAIEWRIGDLRDRDAVFAACAGVDCVWHNAAAVGPFHPKELYHAVNVVASGAAGGGLLRGGAGSRGRGRARSM